MCPLDPKAMFAETKLSPLKAVRDSDDGDDIKIHRNKQEAIYCNKVGEVAFPVHGVPATIIGRLKSGDSTLHQQPGYTTPSRVQVPTSRLLQPR